MGWRKTGDKDIMSRCVMLSSGGDPFLSLFVLKLFQENWYDEVDRFYINYNNHAGVPTDVVSEFVSRVVKEPKVHLIYHPNGIGNGMPITEMVKIAKEDLVMLLEDDGWIWTPGKVNWCFQQIESDLTDATGTPRFSCGTEIAEALKVKHNLDYTKYGDCGPSAWPNFFFCKREDLLRTDLNFGSKAFEQETFYKELDYTMEKTEYADTFCWAFYQMRNNGMRFAEIPQFHVSPTEIQDKVKGELNWYQGQTPYWYHVGSLSAGWNGYLQDRTPDTSNEGAKMEIESRVAGWQLALDQTEGFTEFRVEYQKGIDSLIIRAELDPNRVKEKYDLFRGLMGL